MTFEEFKLKFAELVTKYGFVKETMHYCWRPIRIIMSTEQNC